MKRILPFIRFRNVWFILSTVLIVGGLCATIIFRGGFNFGIDFKGGLSQQIQIAPFVMTVTNSSNRVIDFEINDKEVSYLKAGDKKMVFPRAAGQSLADIVKNIESAGDLKVAVAGGAEFDTSLLVLIHKQLDPAQTTTPAQSLNVNRRLPADAKPQATIASIRGTLSGIPGGVSIQEVGDVINQDFLIRTDPSSFKAVAGEDVSDTVAKTVIGLLEKQYGAGTVVEQSRESLGPQMAQSLATGSIIAIIVALGLMLVYAWIRFRLNFAAAAIISLVHDVLTTIGFVGIFGVEVNTAVVAALLTIIGYSINDTVVVYDRIRENEKIMKGQDLAAIMEFSISQTLNRTVITSFTVFIAIFPLFLFGTGPVRDFSFCMVFGIITGTYSSICIASPIALIWQRGVDKAKRKKEIKLYGQVQTPGLETTPPAVQPEYSVTGETDVTGESGTAGPIVTPEPAPFTTGTGPITRVQRVLEKKKKKRT